MAHLLRGMCTENTNINKYIVPLSLSIGTPTTVGGAKKWIDKEETVKAKKQN